MPQHEQPHPTAGLGARVPQGTPWKARWSQWAEEGAATKSGSASMWCVGVSVGDLMRTWCSVAQDSLIPLRGPGPKDLGTGPQRPGTVMDTSLLIGPKASQGGRSPKGHCNVRRSGWLLPLPGPAMGVTTGPHDPREATPRAAGLRKPMSSGRGRGCPLFSTRAEGRPGTHISCSVGKPPGPWAERVKAKDGH